MPVEQPVAIGLDLGTSGLKAIALDAAGQVVARASHHYPTHRPEPAAAQQDPQDWLHGFDVVLSRIAGQVPASRWIGLGLSAMLPTLVATNEAGIPLSPAITWQDGRAEAAADRLVAEFGDEPLHMSTGQRVDARYLVPMFARLLPLDGPHPPSASYLLGAKDWLVWQLTGRPLSDPSTASGSAAWELDTSAAQGHWRSDILQSIGSPHVPDVVSSATAIPLREEFAERWGCRPGTPLVIGGADSVIGAYGMGVTEPGSVALLAGTSTVLLSPVLTRSPDAQRRTIITPTVTGGWAREADLVATGSAFSWLARLTGYQHVGELLAEADQASYDDAPAVLPYLGPGEQGVLWQPDLTGLFSGVTLRTTAADLALGLLTGLVIESWRCVLVLDTDAPTGPILASGSGTDPAYLRRLADATGKVVKAFTGEPDHSAIGAAALTRRSVLGEAPQIGPPDIVIDPDPAERDRWDYLWQRHEDLRNTYQGGAR